MASADSRDASMMKSLYKDSRSRNFHSTFARADCARWLIQVVTMEAEAPTNEPSAAAIAVTAALSTDYFPPFPTTRSSLGLLVGVAEPQPLVDADRDFGERVARFGV